MTKKNEISVNASNVFNTASNVTLDNAQATLRTSLQALNTALEKGVSAIQVSAVALVNVVHSGAGEDGLKLVPAKSELNEVLKIQIEAIAVNADGTKDEKLSRSLGGSAGLICEQAWCILAGHFRIAYRPKGDNVYFAGQDKAGFSPNPKIHAKGVFRASNVPFPKFKDNGNIRTNSPDDIVPVSATDTKNTFARYMQQKKINADQTGFEITERAGKIETIANAKEALTATLGLVSWFNNQGFVDGQVSADLWDNEELDSSVRNPLFNALIDFSNLIIKAKTVADAIQAEEKLKADETKGNLTADAEAELEKTITNMTPAPLKVSKELAKEIAQIDAKNTQKKKAKTA